MKLGTSRKEKAKEIDTGLRVVGKHTANIKRVARIKGQLEAIDRMLREARYCPEILQQVKSATSALKGLECEILEGHLRGCVKQAFQAKDPFAAEKKITELIDLVRSR